MQLSHKIFVPLINEFEHSVARSGRIKKKRQDKTHKQISKHFRIEIKVIKYNKINILKAASNSIVILWEAEINNVDMKHELRRNYHTQHLCPPIIT